MKVRCGLNPGTRCAKVTTVHIKEVEDIMTLKETTALWTLGTYLSAALTVQSPQKLSSHFTTLILTLRLLK